jgi:glycosyltransferase involved in cell wall biosynthesis
LLVAPCRLDVSTELPRGDAVRLVEGNVTRNATPRAGHAPPHRSFVVVSTYPPTPCGIATFSAALCSGLVTHGADVHVVQVGPPPAGQDDRVVGHVPDDGRAPSTDTTQILQRAGVVILQHEYGIYGGPDGDSVVDLLEDRDGPSIVVAHTVLRSPTRRQREVLEAVARAADAVVVMTEAGRERLITGFDVDLAKVRVIPHGAAVAGTVPHRHRGRAELLTWGLLGPGKGIEWAIDALGMLQDISPSPTYRIAGDTHPKVLALQGEAYRELLIDRAGQAGVADDVQFDSGYRGLPALGELIERATAVVLPYDSPDQVTSGVLVDAVAAGRPVVATAFPHAAELLATGAGLVVPQRDPEALAAALRRLLTEPGLAERMAAEARRLAPALAWPAVAARYTALGDALLARPQAVPA